MALACQSDAPDVGLNPPTFAPADSAVIFAPGVISTAAPEFAAAFTPDGSRVYFNRTSGDRQQIQLLESRFDGGNWSEPAPASFSGSFRDVDPFVTPDGSRLYFSSTRPMPGGGEAWSNGAYEPPELLQFDVNVQGGAGNPLVRRDGQLLIFVSDREGGHGGADLYATCERAGEWSPAVNLGSIVNSAYADFAPATTADGRYLVFSSERPGMVPAVPPDARPPGDIYYVSLAGLDTTCRT